MSRTVQTVVTYKDDLGAAGQAAPLVFSIGNETYEIHLNKRNRETFLRRMGVYTAVAHKPGPLPKVRYRNNPDAPAIRKWAADQGIILSARGRIAADIVEAYNAAHEPQQSTTERTARGPVQACNHHMARDSKGRFTKRNS